MKRDKNFKIYFHRHFYHQLELPIKTKTSFLKRLFFYAWFGIKFVVFGVYGFCLFVGESVVNEFIVSGKSLKQRLKLAASWDFAREHVFLLLGIGCLIITFSGLKLFAEGENLKQQVTGWFDRGQKQIELAGGLLAGQNGQQAQGRLFAALKNFQNAQSEIDQSSLQIKLLLAALPQGSDGTKIIKASQLLTQGGIKLLSFYDDLKNIKLTSEGLSGENDNAKIISSAADDLNSGSDRLIQASLLLKQVDPKNLPKDKQPQFLEVQGQIAALSQTTQSLSEIFGLFSLGALKSNNVLLILENNNELRPGGGFIGSYAAIKQNAGKMSALKLGSIYDIDGQLKENIRPPLPLLAVNDRWYLRDSNWFVSFPASAQKISEFYEKEAGETPDLIVALTPNLIVDMLKLTGPVDMPAYNVTLDADNFVEQVQVLSTMSDQSPENQPKQILADLMPVLLQRLGSLKFAQLGDLLGIIFDNLSQKQLMFYSQNPDLQKGFENLNWAGEIKTTDRDFLSVSAANLGATKSDLFVKQKLDLKTFIGKDGRVTNELALTYANTLPKLDYTFNRRFIRVLVPKNSKLVLSQGFDLNNLDKPETNDFKIDSDALAWEKSTVRDLVTGTMIGEESDYTFFGNWLNLAGGETKTVRLVYELPFKLNSLDHYSLLLQKQPGAMPYSLNYSVSLQGKKILWRSFDDNNNNDTINIQTVFNKDLFWGEVLANNQ